MSRTRRRIGLLAAVLLAIAAVPLTATADDPPISPKPFEVTVDAGRIELVNDVNSNGDPSIRIRRFEADASTPVDNVLLSATKQGKCVINGDISGVLGLSIVGGPPNIGLVSNGLGSSDAKNCNTSNGRIENGQTLKLTLADGLRADYAELDIEGKFGARLLASGTRGDEDTLTTSPDGLALSEEGESDNGSDAGESDNEVVTIGTSAPGDDFDVLRLTPISSDGRGEFSLEGGGDWTSPTVKSIIYLVTVDSTFEYTLGCGDDIKIDFADPNGPSAEQPAQSAFLTRYDAVGKGETACLPIGATITSDGDSITLDNTDFDAFGGEQQPYLRLTLVWRVKLYEADGVTERSIGDVNADLQRQVNFDLETSPLPADKDLPLVKYCLADNDDASGMKPADQPEGINWCLLDERVDVRDGFLIQTQIYDGEGDPRWL